MATRRCPSCGRSYNGKRCKNCLYEPFGEVTTSFELHTADVSSRRDIPPVRRQAAPARPGYPARSRKKNTAGKQILKRIGIFWIVLTLVSSLLPVLVDIVTDLGGSHEEVWAPQPEPIPLPEDALVLYEDADVMVLAGWDGLSPIDEDIPIYVQNFTGKDLTVCTDGVAVNGCMSEDIFFYCDAYRNSVSRATLWADPDVLGKLGIQHIRHIQMSIDVMDEDYNMLVDGAIAEAGDGYLQEMEASGKVLYDQDGFRLVFQGWETNSYGNSTLFFYAENNTDSFMELSGNELMIDGKETGCWLWQNFLPGTKGIFYGRINDFTIPDNDVMVEVELFLTPDGDWSRDIEIGLLNFHLNEMQRSAFP